MLRKEQIFGLVGTTVACVLLLLLLLFVYMPLIQQDTSSQDEGVMISFGDSPDGGGNDMSVQDVYVPAVQNQAQNQVQPKASQQEVVTQNEASEAQVPKTIKVKNDKNDKIDLQNQEQQRVAANQKRQAEMTTAAQNVIGGAFGNSGGHGSGNTTGDTRQGNPAGHGTAGGNSWSLNGRDLTSTLVIPKYYSNEEGRITVAIRVDANGYVTSVNIVSPTNISDNATRNSALDAARRTKFSGGKGVSVGTITYNYRLR